MGRWGRHHRTDPGQSRSPHNRKGHRCKLPKRESSISCSKRYHIEARGCRRTGPMSTHRHSRLRPGAATLDVVVGPEPGIRGGSNQKRGPYLPCAASSRGPMTHSARAFSFHPPLNHNSLDFIEGDLVRGAVVELGGAGGLVGGDSLGVLDAAAVEQVGGDAGGPEGVAVGRHA